MAGKQDDSGEGGADGQEQKLPASPPSGPPVFSPNTPPTNPPATPPPPAEEAAAAPAPAPPTAMEEATPTPPAASIPPPSGGGGRRRGLLVVAALVAIVAIGAGAFWFLSDDDNESSTSSLDVGSGRSEALVVAIEDGEFDVFVLREGGTIEREDRIVRGANSFSLLYENARADRFSGTASPATGPTVPLIVGSKIVAIENDGNEEIALAIDIGSGEITELYSVDADDDNLAISHDRGTFVYVASSGERQTCLVADGLEEPTRIGRASRCRPVTDGLVLIDEDDDRYEVERLDYEGTEIWSATFDSMPTISDESGRALIYGQQVDGVDRFVLVRDLDTGAEVARSSSGFETTVLDRSGAGKLLVSVSDGRGDQVLEVLEPSATEPIDPIEVVTSDESIQAAFHGENRVVHITGDSHDDDGDPRRLDLIAFDLLTLDEAVVHDARGMSLNVVDGALLIWVTDDAEIEILTAPRDSLQLVSAGAAAVDDGRIATFWLVGDTLDILVQSFEDASSVLYRTALGGELVPLVEDINGAQQLSRSGEATLYTTVDDVEETLWHIDAAGTAEDIDDADDINAWFDQSGDRILYVDLSDDLSIGELVRVQVAESGPAEAVADEATWLVPLWQTEVPVRRGSVGFARPAIDGCAFESGSTTRVGRSFTGDGSVNGPRSICLSTSGELVDIDVEADFDGSIDFIDLETGDFLDSIALSDFDGYRLPSGGVRIEVRAWEEVDDMSFRISFG